MSFTLTLLGTADSKGVPRFWCACEVCEEARTTGLNRRTRTALLLRGAGQTVLLDAGSDLHSQLARLGSPLLPDAALISHAHNDHLLGLADLLDYVKYEARPLPIWAPPDVIPHIAGRFAYAFRSAAPVTALPEDGLELAGHRVRLFPVPHGANGQSYAYSLTRSGFRAAVVTDAIDIPPATVRAELTDLDLLILGTSFVDESGPQRPTGRSVYDIREALDLPWARAARRVILTHLSHDVDVREVKLPPGWACAGDGQTVALA
ncbi:phosphoribosyl 1,2-cyclic phosphate phosphodiesterase [Deinococcus reticulitermitis]|uniref:Phosphoribosyl 1,2-cyclic phosphate phosphodiesterase n=1 Tax=Deinococcus reticulitermitis TaxID=856736 RepID=A0A1H6T0X4_9DEIO|nr:MBL fold metallo-hydrolase [Deinococcus reticulitermitis]SEI70737.1 phosphoribosyl 1,2-cyclic phosphate phosphodiesterase [Deinococcus reticulitermitis]